MRKSKSYCLYSFSHEN